MGKNINPRNGKAEILAKERESLIATWGRKTYRWILY
jgi:hypothetical protein